MVETDGGDYLQNRARNGIRRVKASSEPGFEHHDVAVFLREPEESHCGRNFKAVEHYTLFHKHILLLTSILSK